MYKPLDPPKNASPEELDNFERLRQYVLTTGEVAQLFDISNQRVLQLVDAERLECFRDRRASRTTYRFSLADVVASEALAKRKLHLYTLPIEFLQRYDTTSLYDQGERILFDPIEASKHARRWISESQAARVLDLGRTTLRSHRVSGLLNPDLAIREHPSPTVGGVQYDVATIKKVAAGEIPLYTTAYTPPQHEVD